MMFGPAAAGLNRCPVGGNGIVCSWPGEPEPPYGGRGQPAQSSRDIEDNTMHVDRHRVCASPAPTRAHLRRVGVQLPLAGRMLLEAPGRGEPIVFAVGGCGAIGWATAASYTNQTKSAAWCGCGGSVPEGTSTPTFELGPGGAHDRYAQGWSCLPVRTTLSLRPDAVSALESDQEVGELRRTRERVD